MQARYEALANRMFIVQGNALSKLAEYKCSAENSLKNTALVS